MKYYRYMCLAELYSLLDGETLTNRIVHRDVRGSLSNSVGFCFLREKTKVFDEEGNEKKFNPVRCYSFLHGVVSPGAMVEFDTKRKDLIPSEGWYAAPQKPGEPLSWEQLTDEFNGLKDIAMVRITEYSTTHYSIKDMVPLRVYIPDNNPITRDYSMWGKRWIGLKDIPGYESLPL